MHLSESSSPGESASEMSETPYIWAKCPNSGWEALIPSYKKHLPIPDIPGILLAKPEVAPEVNKDRSRSRTPGIRKPRGTGPLAGKRASPDRSTSPRARDPLSASSGWEASLREEPPSHQDSPCDRDFVDLNKRRVSEPSRATKMSLLVQASKQLEESELISTSLAERLKRIHAKLTS